MTSRGVTGSMAFPFNKGANLAKDAIQKTHDAGQMIVEGVGSIMSAVSEIGMKEGEGTGESFFFNIPEEEWDPVVVACRTTTHPDSVLRRLGLIEAHGTHNGVDEVYFSSKYGCWLYESSNSPVDDNGKIMQRVLTKRYDKVPRGVINVVGDLATEKSAPCEAPIVQPPTELRSTSLAHLVDTSVSRKSKAVINRIQQEKVKKAALDNAEHRPSSPSDSNGEPESEQEIVLDDKEIIRLFEQYISRGIVDSARRTESCIVSPGSGRLAIHLASGVHSRQDKGVAGCGHSSEIRTSKTLLLGVSSWNNEADMNLNRFYTHHLVVERSTIPDDETPTQFKHIVTPLQELVRDGFSRTDTFREALSTTARLSKDLNNKKGLLFEKSSCVGFRCRHVDEAYKAVVLDSDGIRPRHCRIVPKGRQKGNKHCNMDLLQDEDEDDEGDDDDIRTVTNMSDSSVRRQRFEADEADEDDFLSSLSLEARANCFRTCECGTRLGPLEVAQCVCGRYDFQHVPREVKMNRMKQLRKLIHDPQTLQYVAFLAQQVTRKPSSFETARYCTSLVASISRGFSPETDSNRFCKATPPRRHAIPVVCVLLGGSNLLKYQIAQYVQKRWPIVAIEGSGGFADVLCSTILRVRCIVQERERAKSKTGKESHLGDAGLDEYRLFLSGIDSMTAEIIINGNIEVIKKGTKTNEFVRKLENCLKGNETLEKAWYLFSQWSVNAAIQKSRYYFFNSMIMLMTILTTAVSVTATFLLLLWSGEQPDINPAASLRHFIWMILRWSVVLFPIVITFVQAVANKDHAGPKWVRLHCASQQLLSEIYKYRTRTLEYASENMVSKSQQSKKSGTNMYASREELLQQRIQTLTDMLSLSEVANVTLVQYTGPLPPRSIRRTGDDGFSELGPDKYKRVRLDTVISDLERRSRVEGHSITVLTILINISNAGGTIFAALASYGLGYMQAWVALTTALAAALTRWLDFTRLEFMQKKLNIAINNLSSVSVWWAGQGAVADNKANRDKLIEETETHILEETTMWGKIIQGSGKDASGASHCGGDAENAKRPKKTEKEKLRDIGGKHGLELEDLELDKIAAAIKNPSSNHGKAVMDTVRKIMETGSQAKDDNTKKIHVQAVEKEATQVNSNVNQPRRITISTAIVSSVQHPDTRTKLLDAIIKLDTVENRTVNRWSILEASRAVPEFFDLVKDLTTRELLEVCKGLIVEQLVSYFTMEEHYTSIPPNQIVRLKRKHLVAQSLAPSEALLKAELFISEMRCITKTEGSIKLDPVSLVNVIKDQDVKLMFRSLPAAMRKNIRNAADALFNYPVSERLMTRNHYLVMLLEDVAELIAEIDVDEFLENIETRVKIWKKLPVLAASSRGSKGALFSKAQLTRDFPPAVSKRLIDKSPLQIQKYMQRLILGTPTSRTFKLTHQKFDLQLKGYVDKLVFHPSGDAELRERLVLCIAGLDQIIINRLSRGLLVRKLKNCIVYNEDADIIFSTLRESDLRFFLSTVQATLSNSYSSRLVDRAADEILSFDVRSTIPYILSEKLVSKIREFRMVDEDNKVMRISKLSKKEIFRMLENASLADHLNILSSEQLHELLENLLALSSRSYPVLVFGKVKESISDLTSVPILAQVVQDWDAEFIDSLVHVVGTTQVVFSQIKDCKEKYTASEVIGLIAANIETAEGLSDLRNAARDVGMEDGDIRDMLLKLLIKIQTCGGDRTLTIAFENANITSTTGTLEGEDVQMLFDTPEARENFTKILASLPTLETHLLFGDDAEDVMVLFEDALSGQPDLLSMVRSVKAKTDTYFKRFLSAIISELSVDAPLRMFHDLASRISMFDLRDVVTGYSNRRRLVMLIYEIYFMDGSVRDHKVNEVPTSLGVDRAENWLNRRLGGGHENAQSVEYAPGLWRLGFLREAGLCGEGEYEKLLNDLRILSEVQLKIVAEEMISVMRDTPSGRLLIQYLRLAKKRLSESGNDESWSQWLIVSDAIDILRQKIKVSPSVVAAVFSNYNIEAFQARTYEVRERALMSLLENDAACDLLLSFSPGDLERKVLTYLSPLYGPLPRSRFIQETRERHRRNWDLLRGGALVATPLMNRLKFLGALSGTAGSKP